MEGDSNWIVYNAFKISEKVSSFVSSLDHTISKNFNDTGIETRPVKSNGLWCSVLIPIILLLYAHIYPVSPIYKQTAYLSIGLLCYSLLFIVFITVSSLVVKVASYGGCMASSLISTIFLYACAGQELYVALPISAICVISYYSLLRFCLNTFPKTFTVGELMIIQQSVVLFTFMLTNQVIFLKTDEETIIFEVTVFTVLSAVGVIVISLSLFKENTRTVEALIGMVLLAAMVILSILHIAFGMRFLFKFFALIFLNSNRIKLLIAWLFLLLMTVVILVGHTLKGTKATTVTRKPFHVCAALVFMTGILGDVQLMRLAAAAMLAVIILMEALRKSDIKPISQPLQTVFELYKDEKDCGSFALTPIYLYIGLAFPLALVPDHGGARLEMLSGVLATGVGDTAASWFGHRYGVNKWPDSYRTKEGTFFNVVTQLLTVYVLMAFELLESRSAILRTAIAATVTALVEARTEQVDNLVLPLVMILGYQSTFFLPD